MIVACLYQNLPGTQASVMTLCVKNKIAGNDDLHIETYSTVRFSADVNSTSISRSSEKQNKTKIFSKLILIFVLL